MEKPRVLFISQEITPYLPENEMSKVARYLPQGIQERGKEIRTFMPRYGCVNERRHQLHEVIRLSGMNMIIDDTDHPLIIKVASIQPARMQVYFIDNEEYFQRKAVCYDADGKVFADNDERAIFFCRGVLETVKKLGWSPDIIHCHGWMTALVPMYVKTTYADDPMFSESKVVYSVYDNAFKGKFHKDFAKKAIHDGVKDKHVTDLTDPTFVNVNKLAIKFADAVAYGSEKIHSDLEAAIVTEGKPTLSFQNEETYLDAHSNFYDEILVEQSLMV